jgi:hypothetical protein
MKRQSIEKIEQRGGYLPICQRIADGETLADIAREYEMSRSVIQQWFGRDPDRREALRRARVLAAASLADQALSIADQAESENVQVAKLRIETRRWLASRMDPEQYGDRPTNAVQINIGTLHLDALRHTVAGPVIDVTPVESTT